MGFVKEKIPEEEKENFDLKKLRHRLLPRQVTKDQLSLWIADKETGAFLVWLFLWKRHLFKSF